jgi:hypothetical protein
MMNMSMGYPQGGQKQGGGQLPDWLMSALGMGAGGSMLGQGLFGMFGKQKNPADAANKYINQIPGATEPYYSPYINAGKGAMGDLQNQYKDLIGGNVQNQLGANYKESPGYQFKLQQAMGAGNRAAAAGGMSGTPAHEQMSMETANGLASQDYNDYIKNQMGLYGLGTGIGQDIFGKGYGASGDMASTLGNSLSQQAGYGYAGQAGKNAQNASNWGNLFGGAAALGAGLPGFLSEWFK